MVAPASSGAFSLAGRAVLKAARLGCNTWARASGPVVNAWDGAAVSEVQIGKSLTGLEIAAQGAKEDRILLHFHGGAHCLGNVWLTREMCGRMSAAAEARLVSVEYRLSPEHPFPAALDDALEAWRWARDAFPNASVAFAGESAGGNLAFATLLRLAQLQERMPVACVTMSPWLHLHKQAPVQKEAPDMDPLLAREVAAAQMWNQVFKVWHYFEHQCVDRYMQGTCSSNPLVSPVLASEELVRTFPPVLIHCARGEPLVEEARAMAELCRRSGVTTELEVFPNWLHVFQILPMLRDSKTSMSMMGEFLQQHWKRKENAESAKE